MGADNPNGYHTAIMLPDRASCLKLVWEKQFARGRWQHVTVSVSPKAYEVYLDGEPVKMLYDRNNNQDAILSRLFADNAAILKQYKYSGIGPSVYTTDKDLKAKMDECLRRTLLGHPGHEQIDSLVQIKLAGDTYDAAYAMGNTMRNGESVRRLRYCEQRVLGMEKAGRAERMEEAGKAEEIEGIGRVEGIGGIESADTLARAQDTLEIHTILEAEAQYRVRHILTWKKGAPYVRIRCQIENTGAEAIRLEMLESFSLGSLSPYLEGDGHGQMLLHRLRSVWSQEGRLETIPVEDLQLEPAWDPHAVRCEKFGQAGSMPVNKFFPFAAVEDRQSGVFWGAQLACPASWQMELYRKDDALALSGGLADRDFGHWMKGLHPGESFLTPEAIVSTAHTPSIDVFTARLTQAALEQLRLPED